MRSVLRESFSLIFQSVEVCSLFFEGTFWRISALFYAIYRPIYNSVIRGPSLSCFAQWSTPTPLFQIWWESHASLLSVSTALARVLISIKAMITTAPNRTNPHYLAAAPILPSLSLLSVIQRSSPALHITCLPARSKQPSLFPVLVLLTMSIFAYRNKCFETLMETVKEDILGWWFLSLTNATNKKRADTL